MAMVKIYQRDIIKDTVKNWETIDPHPISKWHIKVAQRLAKIDPETISVEEFNKLFDNKKRYDLECRECGETVPVLIRLGDEDPVDPYDGTVVHICEKCLDQAKAILQEK